MYVFIDFLAEIDYEIQNNAHFYYITSRLSNKESRLRELRLCAIHVLLENILHGFPATWVSSFVRCPKRIACFKALNCVVMKCRKALRVFPM